MNRKVTISAIAAVSFALAACGQAGTNQSSASENLANAADNMANAANEATEATGNMLSNATATLPQTAAEFAAAAGASDLFEIEASKLAQTKTTNPKLKDFAATMVKDHTKSTADLKAIAAKEKITLSAPLLNPDMQAKIDALKAATPAEFDALYLSQQIPAHEAALNMLQGYAATGDNQAVKGFAAKVTPIVQHHLDEARALAK